MPTSVNISGNSNDSNLVLGCSNGSITDTASHISTLKDIKTVLSEKGITLPDLGGEEYTCPDYLFGLFQNISVDQFLNEKLTGFSIMATQLACQLLNFKVKFDTTNGNGSASAFITGSGAAIPAQLGIFWVINSRRSALSSTGIEYATSRYNDAVVVKDAAKLEVLRTAIGSLTNPTNQQIIEALYSAGFTEYVTTVNGTFAAFDTYRALATAAGMTLKEYEVENLDTVELSTNQWSMSEGATTIKFANGVKNDSFARLTRFSNLGFYINDLVSVPKKSELVRGLKLIAPFLHSLVRMSGNHGTLYGWEQKFQFTRTAHNGMVISPNFHETNVLIERDQLKIDASEAAAPRNIGSFNFDSILDKSVNVTPINLVNYRFHNVTINDYAPSNTSSFVVDY